MSNIDPVKLFEADRGQRIKEFGEDDRFNSMSRDWLEEAMRKSYAYNFTWLGRPIIQTPMDIVAMQELIWKVAPDLIIETGIAHGGSIILSASILELIYACGGGDGEVLAIDIDIRSHNFEAIKAHPLSKRIKMIQGSSISPEVVAQVKEAVHGKKKVMVFLDSNHTHDHVMHELEAYAPLVSKDSYCVVFDTFVEDMPEKFFADRPWDKGNNPKTAVWEWLKEHQDFEIDKQMQNKLQITVAPDGFLRRVR